MRSPQRTHRQQPKDPRILRPTGEVPRRSRGRAIRNHRRRDSRRTAQTGPPIRHTGYHPGICTVPVSREGGTTPPTWRSYSPSTAKTQVDWAGFFATSAPCPAKAPTACSPPWAPHWTRSLPNWVSRYDRPNRRTRSIQSLTQAPSTPGKQHAHPRQPERASALGCLRCEVSYGDISL